MRPITLFRPLFFFCLLLMLSLNVFAKGKQVVKIAYLTQLQKPRPPTSNIDPIVENKGFPGAELGVEDNNTTGEYTKQFFSLDKFIVPADGDVMEIYTKKIATKYAFVVTNLGPQLTNAIADLEQAQNQLILDVQTVDDALRNKECRANVLHLLPSRAMRADALAQYLMKKRWTKWFLVVGTAPEDKLFSDALKRAAKRFGMKIIQEKAWEHTFDARKSAQSDVAVFTQIEDDYDVLVVADEQGQFGEYLEYRTWFPRPVAGTQGLIATSWHRAHEQWGASQIQNRFKERAGRWMEEQDYSAYLAIRAIGESATRTKSNELKPIKDHLLGNEFALQGYKGTPLSFRSWDHQLRQPILLTAPRSLVSVAPIEGFLHPKTELDTLGYDQPETDCQWNKGQ
ncbi:MAG: ABC transporter substrate-binding protein [Methylococcaceae bacterium]|nr:ABC transporter substrate-binding protein [Methylococcaceae bacterium]